MFADHYCMKVCLFEWHQVSLICSIQSEELQNVLGSKVFYPLFGIRARSDLVASVEPVDV
jgi:hypothetical protein